ncbi:MAG: hypothetical protein ACR2H1_10450, partial [Limisphaerales bacterium]
PLLVSTNGAINQWHFYKFTNTFTSFTMSGTNGTNINATNVAFATFSPPNLSGINPLHEWPSRKEEADIDLYVSTDPGLLTLDPTAIANARKSTERGGTEAIVYTNSTIKQVYYIGVKSEDQQAAEYGFFGIASETPFSQIDANGNLIITGVPAPVAIPDETSVNPHGVNIIGFISQAPPNFNIRRVIVTNTITHELIGDLFGVLTYKDRSSVLNNHTLNSDRTNRTVRFIYDDSDQGDVFPQNPFLDVVGPTDFPGTLRNFVGQKVTPGAFILHMIDNAPLHLGTNESLFIRVEPQPTNNGIGGITTILANRWFYDFVEVPVDATNLQVVVTYPSPLLQGTVEAYLRREAFPTQTIFDKKAIINPPGGTLSLGLNDSPPLSPGFYILGFFNPTGLPIRISYRVNLDYNLAPTVIPSFTSTGVVPLIDDAVTTSTLFVNQDRRVVDVQVGVRIDHPRISDLSLRLT